jgi:hypothetical protein
MQYKRIKTFTLALVMAGAMAPFALGQGQVGTPGTPRQQPGMERPGTQQTRPQGQQGMQSQQPGQSMAATVQEVDKQNRTLTLRSMEGDTVELKVPAAMLSNLQAGDSVEVSIHKAYRSHQQDLGGSQQSQPGQSGNRQQQPGQSR